MTVACATPALSATRAELEEFLYTEAALLDAWKLDEWLALFADNARYLVPPAGAADDADPATTLFYVADDYHRLGERVKRLNKVSAHAEFPHSKCRRLVSNVRLLGGTDVDFTVTSNYVTYRSKMGSTQVYFGHHVYVMQKTQGIFKILKKTSFIDADDIRDQNKISIIL